MGEWLYGQEESLIRDLLETMLAGAAGGSGSGSAAESIKTLARVLVDCQRSTDARSRRLEQRIDSLEKQLSDLRAVAVPKVQRRERREIPVEDLQPGVIYAVEETESA